MDSGFASAPTVAVREAGIPRDEGPFVVADNGFQQPPRVFGGCGDGVIFCFALLDVLLVETIERGPLPLEVFAPYQTAQGELLVGPVFHPAVHRPLEEVADAFYFFVCDAADCANF